MYQERNLLNPACVVDANHSNSGKRHMEQIRIVKEVMHSRTHSKEIENLVKGVMIESYIEAAAKRLVSIFMANQSLIHVLIGTAPSS